MVITADTEQLLTKFQHSRLDCLYNPQNLLAHMAKTGQSRHCVRSRVAPPHLLTTIRASSHWWRRTFAGICKRLRYVFATLHRHQTDAVAVDRCRNIHVGHQGSSSTREGNVIWTHLFRSLSRLTTDDDAWVVTLSVSYG